MDPLAFKPRFIAALGEIPAWVDLKPEEFVTFDPRALAHMALRTADVVLLTEIGMPKSAAPFLDFTARTSDELEALRGTFGIPKDFLPIGNTNSGDYICIDGGSGEVIRFAHDLSLPSKSLVNSSLLQFAESLCVFQELFVARRLSEAANALRHIDPPAMVPGAMWYEEARARAA